MLINFNFIEIYASFFYHAILLILSYQNTRAITLKKIKNLKKPYPNKQHIFICIYLIFFLKT